MTSDPRAPSLQPLSFDALAGFADDDALAAWRAFRDWAQASLSGAPEFRKARAPSPGLMEAAAAAVAADLADAAAARRFFVERFRPWRVGSDAADGSGFLTGYYEPIVEGALTQTPAFSSPLFARPADLVSFPPGGGPRDFDPALAGAQRLPDGTLRPYPERAEIEARDGEAIAWLADPVEVFFVQVQGSARLRLPDGREARLVYDGRNGQPYTSIGRLLIEAGEIGEREMSLARLKAWLRTNGLRVGERGRAILQRNRSYIFFRLETGADPALGPIGGAGVALTPLRSIAVDRTIWPYGTPFWIDADLPWASEAPSPFSRLMIAQDTGSAILGAARADIFFGAGEAAGGRAGDLRHRGDFTVLLPIGDEP
ncbi:MAG: transglycosylase [Bradyrhizobium sp.]|nr:MAG: transglycosylase [Bradyrhizobium sp.]